MKGGAGTVMRKQTKSMAIFVALLLLAGIFHVTDVVIHRKGIYYPSTLMFSTVTMIYSGLILFWVQSVRIRLLPSRAKNDIIASGLLMLLFHFVRSVRYRMMVWSPFALFLSRHCWYFWYVPIIMVPTLFLTSILAFGKGPEQKRNRSRWILIPAILLGAGIMTNDLHHLYQTAITVTDDRDTLRQAVGTFVYPEPDTRLAGMELNAGYTFFAKDESVLHRLNEELQDANEVLSMENEVLAREQEQSPDAGCRQGIAGSAAGLTDRFLGRFAVVAEFRKPF